MTGRWAAAQERLQLQELWKCCFGDGYEVSGAFFDAFPPETHTRVISIESRVAAMVSWMPVTVCSDSAELPGAYIYAVATDPQYRGRGLCTALMRETEEIAFSQGAEFAALWPASASLFGFYGAMGYAPAFGAKTLRALPTGDALMLTELSPEEYRHLREAYVPKPFCRWDDAAFSYLAGTAVRFFRFPGGCGAYFPLPDGGIRVPELLGAKPEDFCSGLCAPYGIVTIPDNGENQGMLKWRGAPKTLPGVYLGFAFD